MVIWIQSEVKKMYLNKSKLVELMVSNYGGNYRKFSKVLGVEAAQLHRIVNSDSQAGTVFLGRLYKYCINNGLGFEEYIYFD